MDHSSVHASHGSLPATSPRRGTVTPLAEKDHAGPVTTSRDLRIRPGHVPPEAFPHFLDEIRDYAMFFLDPTGHVSRWHERTIRQPSASRSAVRSKKAARAFFIFFFMNCAPQARCPEHQPCDKHPVCRYHPSARLKLGRLERVP